MTLWTRRRTLLLVTLLATSACAHLPWHHASAPPAAIDLNNASLRKIEQLPGVTPSMARQIVAGRPYGEPDDLVARGILSRHDLDRISDRLKVTP